MGGISRFVGLLLLPIFTRVFSVDDYGIIDIYSVFTNLIIVTATLRLSTSISRYFSETDRGFSRKELCSTLLFFNICVNIIIFSFLFLLSENISYLITGRTNAADFVVLSALSASFQSISKIPMMVLRRQRRIITFSSLQIFASVLYASMSLLFILIFDLGLKGIFSAMVISNGVILVGSLFSIRKLLIPRISKNAMITSLRYSLPLMPGKYFMWFNGQVNRVMLLYMIGLSGVGLFAIGSRIASILQLFLTVFQRAWNPFSVEIINAKGSNFIYKKTLTYYLGITSIAGIILSLLTPLLLMILTTEEFYTGQTVVPWLIGAFIISGSSRILNIGTVIKEEMAYNSKAEIITFSANLIISYLLISTIGFKGAAIGMFFSQLLSKSYIWYITQKISDILFENNKVFYILSIYLFCSLAISIQPLLSTGNIFIDKIPLLFCIMGIISIYKISIDTLLKEGLGRLYVESKKELKNKLFRS